MPLLSARFSSRESQSHSMRYLTPPNPEKLQKFRK
jgi:hypothetical protein